MVAWAHVSQYPKQNLYWFNQFCKSMVTTNTDRQTDRQTDRPHYIKASAHLQADSLRVSNNAAV